MSLTAFLKHNRDVREAFSKQFRKPDFREQKPLAAPPLTNEWSPVGTAFDYLLRFIVEQLNPGLAKSWPWVAEVEWELIGPDKELESKRSHILSETRRQLQDYLRTGVLKDEMLRSALLLAPLDSIARVDRGYEDLGNFNQRDVQDLRNLAQLVDAKLFKAKTTCLLNPTFGKDSLLDADADLVIDDMIIDVKVTKKLSLERSYMDQLLGYYVLHQLHGIGGLEARPPINRLAIYFARHGYLYVFNPLQLMQTAELDASLRWFKERAEANASIWDAKP